MKTLQRRPRVWLAILAAVLPAMLILSAIRTFAELNSQKLVYLRSRAAAVAARLETLRPDAEPMAELADSEPGLLAIETFDRASSPASLAALWEGKELFRTERLISGQTRLFRAFVPFHGTGGTLRLARIDLDELSAGFLLEHATHHLWIVGVGALMIVALSWLTARSISSAAQAEQERSEIRNLARLGEMSAVLAHEIRNPLGTIKGFAQLLSEKAGAEDAALIAPILSETERLEALVKDLLAYGRPAQPVYRPADTLEIARVLEQHASRHPGRVQIEASPCSFITDPALLEQALLNLLQNALEATRDVAGGVVQLEVRPANGGVTFRVTDNGAGFSAEATRRLFEAFYTSKATGTGLGLSITRRLVESLGGSFTIGNRPEGGAAAEIRLPLTPAEQKC